MYRIYLTLLLLLPYSAGLYASNLQTEADTTKAKRRALSVYMNVADHLTHSGIDSLRATLLLAADSSFVDSVHVEGYTSNDKRVTYVVVSIREAGNYLLRLEADGYQTRYVPVEIPKLYKRERYRQMKAVYMRKRKGELAFGDSATAMQEVVVKATKLKFYMDGDTLVYDADAFSLAEGSMLNSLIKKLPGVELNSGGEITVNGRKVDALLLNGKDFFDSDRELLLENMPAYMVKSIQNYERTPEEVKGTNREKTTPKQLVMNVRLKKDYNTAWLANAEGGAGMRLHGNQDFEEMTKAPPFLARSFAMRYSTNSRLALFANANNLSDYRTPGEKGEWSPLTQSQGLTTSYTLGANGLIENDKGFRYQGSATGVYSERDDAQHTSRETFLTGGNSYGRSFWSQRSYNYDAKTEHELRYHHSETIWNIFKGFSFNYRPSLQYMHWRNHSESGSATLAEDVAAGWGKAWMDSLMTPYAGDLLRRYSLNRTISRVRGNGHWLNWRNNGYFYMAPAHNDNISFFFTYGYDLTDRYEDTYEHYQLDYPRTGEASDRRNRYRPAVDKTGNLSISPSANFNVGKHDSKFHQTLQILYNYTRNRTESSKDLYLLNLLDEWADPENHALGTLPSTHEMMRTLDADNSYWQRNVTVTNTPHIDYSFSHFNDSTGSDYYLSVDLSLPIRYERMNYWQGAQVDTLVIRRNTTLSTSVYFYHSHRKTDRYVNATYNTSVSFPSMRNMLNIHNTSDPLYTYLGNPSLRTSRNHNLWGYYREKLHRTLVNATFNINVMQDAVAWGTLYNLQNGKRITMPQNVNGNWNSSLSAGVDFPIVRDERLRLKQDIRHRYNHSVDLIGTVEATLGSTEEQMTHLPRSLVASHYLDEELSLSWRPTDKLDFTAKCDLHYQHSTSEREDFQTLNVFDYDYGLSGQVELPWNFQLSTDLTMYSRRGYSDTTMNTNELVWNARLTKRFMHGNLLLQLDAFDLLGQLSNVRRTINAQGMTETFYNVIPSYALLHLTWKLNKKPKKD